MTGGCAGTERGPSWVRAGRPDREIAGADAAWATADVLHVAARVLLSATGWRAAGPGLWAGPSQGRSLARRGIPSAGAQGDAADLKIEITFFVSLDISSSQDCRRSNLQLV